jgi:hypothetical protein
MTPEPSTSPPKRVRLLGGIHRDVTSRADEPLKFFLTINRGLASGKLDDVELDEDQILRLIVEGAKALEMLRKEHR